MRMRSAAARPPTIRARLTDGHRRGAPREQAHSVVHHQRGYRSQRDAGGGQIACLPGEVGDSADQRDGRCHLVDRLGEIDMVGQPDPHTERTPTGPYNTTVAPPSTPGGTGMRRDRCCAGWDQLSRGTPDNHLMFLELLM